MRSLKDMLFLDLDDEKDALYYGSKVLEESQKWDKAIAKKRKELESVLELSAMSNSEVHSSNIGDPTHNVAMKKMAIRLEIDDILKDKNRLAFAINKLPDQEKEVLKGFYFTKGRYISAIVDDICNEYDISPRQVYLLKNRAILSLISHLRDFL